MLHRQWKTHRAKGRALDFYKKGNVRSFFDGIRLILGLKHDMIYRTKKIFSKYLANAQRPLCPGAIGQKKGRTFYGKEEDHFGL